MQSGIGDASAKPFVPHSARAADGDEVDASLSGMNLGAAPFVPGQAAPPAAAEDAAAAAAAPPGHVPVIRDGCFFYVPEDQAAAEEAHASMNPDFFDWTYGQAAIAQPYQTCTVADLSGPPALQEYYRQRSIQVAQQLDPNDARLKELPPQFHSIWPLDADGRDDRLAGAFGHPSTLYKAVSAADSRAYACRRFDTVRCAPKVAAAAQAAWTSVRHAGIVALKEVIVSQAAAFFVHAFHPGARTLRARLLEARQGAPEARVWSFLCQVGGAISAAHASGLAVRCVDAAHVLLCADGRFRVGGCGVLDVIEFESRKTVADMQALDLVNLGRLALGLAVGAELSDAGALHRALELVRQAMSAELCGVLEALVSRPVARKELSAMLGEAALTELALWQNACDVIGDAMDRECENGRALRLLLKLGCVNERPETEMDEQWSESGERYVLKLFRDYVFHQVDDDGRPVVDFGHMAQALNKLDVGEEEHLLLSTRDGRHVLVASFDDVKRKLEAAFAELYHAGDRADAQAPPYAYAAPRGRRAWRGGRGGGAPAQGSRGHAMGRGVAMAAPMQPRPMMVMNMPAQQPAAYYAQQQAAPQHHPWR